MLLSRGAPPCQHSEHSDEQGQQKQERGEGEAVVVGSDSEEGAVQGDTQGLLAGLRPR